MAFFSFSFKATGHASRGHSMVLDRNIDIRLLALEYLQVLVNALHVLGELSELLFCADLLVFHVCYSPI